MRSHASRFHALFGHQRREPVLTEREHMPAMFMRGDRRPAINDDSAFRNDPSHRQAGANIYTAFCRSVSGKGSTWISTVDADDAEAAREEAVEQCAADWRCDDSEVECIGLAEGDVKILDWMAGK